MAKTPATPPLLRVSDLHRSFGELHVLEGLDLELRSGEALALVGPNGAGKSTALRCIAGADQATSGTVELDGEPLDERSAATRRDLAVVMDDLDFFPDLSVVEHLNLLARAHRVAGADAVVDAVLADVGLEHQAAQLPGTLSSGQRRRLALASAFVRPRRLLILDEPEQRLDAAGLAWLAERLNAEKADGLGVLLVSHDAGLVEAVADWILDLGDL
ncbi:MULTISPECIES: ABC transporter ATP-binding protein [Aeromicrobium]|uniref:ABC transporter ATP-binding protein n=1 Tax=Aeromicrobium TaxID=2040 RepID=UPI0006FF3392|nr:MULTISPECIES: ABC transporter ATP-binding protein [Aeromicrobium]KQX76011.1 ABC transporter ATP-binding protein [Aeromicrobium sp. Root472D3]MCL8253353.1 ABC transporter ATP-binding protein [Aeromicrobium fastidiosum]